MYTAGALESEVSTDHITISNCATQCTCTVHAVQMIFWNVLCICTHILYICNVRTCKLVRLYALQLQGCSISPVDLQDHIGHQERLDHYETRSKEGQTIHVVE